MTTKHTAVETAISRAVGIRHTYEVYEGDTFIRFEYPPFTLEDVLRAVESTKHEDDTKLGVIACLTLPKSINISARWHLGKPLSEQSDDVVKFLHGILCV